MNKILFWITIVVLVAILALVFTPVLKSPLGSLGWSTVFIASIPGILTLLAAIFSFKNRLLGGSMFLILAAVFGYYIYNKLLASNYLMISILLVIAGILFLASIKYNKKLIAG